MHYYLRSCIKNGTKYLEVLFVDEAKNISIYEFHNLVIEALDCLSLKLQGLSLAYPAGIDKTSSIVIQNE